MTRTRDRWFRNKVGQILNVPSDKLDNSIISFYQELLASLPDPLLNEDEQALLVTLANRYLNQGVAEDQIKVLITWAEHLKNEWGEVLFQRVFFDLAKQDDWTYAQLSSLGNGLMRFSAIAPSDSQTEFTRYINGNHDLRSLTQWLEQKIQQIKQQKYPQKPLAEVIKQFQQPSPDVHRPLTDTQLDSIVAEYKDIDRLADSFSQLTLEQLQIKIKQSGGNKSQLLAGIREMIRRQYGIFPYNTQMLAVLGLLANSVDLKGCLAQIRTGEGKSTVIAMLAAFLALQGRYIDIVTSKHYLAKRDQEKYHPFFESLGIHSSHICVPHPTREHFLGQIVYGTLTDFQFSILRERLWLDTKVRLLPNSTQPRPCDVVIADEVDSMLLDKTNSARLAVPAPYDLRLPLAAVFKFVQKYPLSSIKQANNAYIDRLKTNIAEQFPDIHSQWDLTLDKLTSWVCAAMIALQLKEKEDYVITKRSSDEKSHTDANDSADEIVIVDHEHTGDLLEGMRYRGFIHEMLELKHQLPMPIQPGRLTAGGLSSITFFTFYKKIFGVTGTMGGEVIREEIKELYGLESFDVPPHLPNQRKKLEDCYFIGSDEAYLDKLKQEIEYFRARGRPVLLLTQTIKASEKLSAALSASNIPHQLYNNVQSTSEKYVILGAGGAGGVTVATNNAGRGTDFILSPEAKQAGGLVTIFTFYPKNKRVEEQGYGRAARQGEPGSVKRMIHASDDTIIGENKLLNLSQAEIFTLLDKQRELKNIMQSKQRRLSAQIMKIDYQLLQEFFDNIQNWDQAIGTDFIHQLAQQMRNSDLTPTPMENDEKQTEHSSDQLIALQQRLTILLQASITPLDNFISWLEDFKKHLMNKEIIEPWALFFNEQDGSLRIPTKSNPLDLDPQRYEEKIVEEYKPTQQALKPIFENPSLFFKKRLCQQFHIAALNDEPRHPTRSMHLC